MLELQKALKLHESNRKQEKDLYKKMVQGLQNDPKSVEKHLNQSTRWVGHFACYRVCALHPVTLQGAYALAAAVVAVIGIGIFYYFQNHKQ